MKNSKENKKVSIFIGIIIFLVVVGIAVTVIFFLMPNKQVGKDSEDTQVFNVPGDEHIEYDGTVKINNSEYLQYEKTIGDFVFSNFYVYSIDGVSRIEFDVTNTSEIRQKLFDFNFLIYTETEMVGKVKGEGTELASEETRRLSIVVDADIANLYDIVVERVFVNVM